MENTQQNIANQFWEENFSEWLDTPLTDVKATESEFWATLQDKLEAVDEQTAWAIALANPIIQITSPDMHFRIARTAKNTWEQKHYQIGDRDAKRRKELGID